MMPLSRAKWYAELTWSTTKLASLVLFAVTGIYIVVLLPDFVELPASYSAAWVGICTAAVVLYFAIPEHRSRFRIRSIGPAVWWLPMIVLADLVCGCTFLFLWLEWAGMPTPGTVPDPFDAFGTGPLAQLLVLMLGAVIAPLVEEAGWRGLIQERLEKTTGPAVAIVVSAATFALAHAIIWALPSLFLGGLILGCAAYWSQSILPGIVLHSAWNGTMQFLSLTDSMGDSPPDLSVGMQVALSALFLVTLITLFWMLRKLAPAPTPSPTPLSDRRTVATSAG